MNDGPDCTCFLFLPEVFRYSLVRNFGMNNASWFTRMSLFVLWYLCPNIMQFTTVACALGSVSTHLPCAFDNHWFLALLVCCMCLDGCLPLTNRNIRYPAYRALLVCRTYLGWCVRVTSHNNRYPVYRALLVCRKCLGWCIRVTSHNNRYPVYRALLVCRTCLGWCICVTSHNNRYPVYRALLVCWTHLEWCTSGTSALCKAGDTACCRMSAWLSLSCHAIASWKHATTLRWKR